MLDRQKLGEALLKEKKITKEQWQMALSMHDKIGGDFAFFLVKLGYISDADITRIVGDLEGVETVDIANLIIPKKLVQSIPRDVIEKHNVIPISRRENQITLAMSNVHDYKAIEEIQFLTGCKVDPVLASRDTIRRSIIQFYSEEEAVETTSNADDTDEAALEKEIEQNPAAFCKALARLLIEKNIITKQDLASKLESKN